MGGGGGGGGVSQCIEVGTIFFQVYIQNIKFKSEYLTAIRHGETDGQAD